MVVETEDFVVKVKGGGLTLFAYNRRFDALDDLRLIVIDEDGTVTQPTARAVGSSAEGATFITEEPVAVTADVVMFRETRRHQLTKYSSGNFPSTQHEGLADRLTMMAQERSYFENRSLRLEFGADEIDAIIAKPNAVLMFDGTGNPVAGPSAEDVEGAQANAQAAVEARVAAEVASNQAARDAASTGANAGAAASSADAAAANLLALGEALNNVLGAFSVDADGDLIVSYNSSVITEIQITPAGDLTISYEV